MLYFFFAWELVWGVGEPIPIFSLFLCTWVMEESIPLIMPSTLGMDGMLCKIWWYIQATPGGVHHLVLLAYQAILRFFLSRQEPMHSCDCVDEYVFV